MNVLGTHLLLELEGCNPQLLNDLPYIRQALVEAAESTGAHIVGQTFHQFSPHGVTGVVAIAESHLCIHTWPEYGYAAVDVFTCGEGFDAHGAASLVIQRLKAQRSSIMELLRGVKNEAVETKQSS
ncbi:MAG: adenosylmethionine decarboxylase [Chloroflexi bacterium]|nr:adenosylmethionine decarboxylase [Chloroflexota bacterium]